jgi:hypothetical protein
VKYMLMFCANAEDQQGYMKLSDEERNALYGRVGTWYQKHASKIKGGEQLSGPETAKTVRFKRDQQPVVTDGPFIEGKEIFGRFNVIDVQDLDEALAIAKEWPASSLVEVRPIMEM